MRNKKMILTLIILLVVGFASVSTTLFLNGVIGISSKDDDFNIIFTSAKLNNRKRNDFISEDKKTINFETNKLTMVDEEAYLNYEVTNTSRLYDGEVVISCIVPENDYVIVDYQPRSMTVNAGKTESGRITSRLLKASSEDDSISIKCTLNATATERDTLGDEYVEPFSKSGMLMAYKEDAAFWAYRGNITKVVFEDKMNEHETSDGLIFDVSALQDKSVMSYLVPNEDNNEMYTLYIQSETGVKANPNSSHLFDNFINLIDINGIEYFDTSNTLLMNSMFSNCKKLAELDLSNFDTKNVTDMGSMFYECNTIEILDVSSFDTSNVTTMSYMFGAGNGFSGPARNLIEIIGLEKFNVQNTKNMSFMFCTLSKITSFNIKNWDTSSATTMRGMFGNCKALVEMDLNNWDVSKVLDIALMFMDCSKLNSIKLSNWKLNNTKDFTSMFFNCTNLQHLDVHSWTLDSATSFNNMFYNCQKLSSIDVNSWNTSNVTGMSQMFGRCYNLSFLNVINWNTQNVKNMSNMFTECRNLIQLDLSNFDTRNVTDMSGMFYNCNSLKKLNISNFNFSKVTNLKNMFWLCKSLESIDVSRWDTSNVTNMSGIFAYCESLESLDVSNWNTSKVTDMSSTFGYLRKVKELDVSKWDTSNVTTMRAMFVECNVLGNLNLSNFDMSKVTNLQSFLAGCHYVVTEFTIRGTACTLFDDGDDYWSIFTNTAISSGKVTVNYTEDASDLVDQMIATKSDYSKVYKGNLVV